MQPVVSASPSGLLVILLLLASQFVLSACDGPFPSFDKPSVPLDHNVNKKGALHKSGLEHPLAESAGCGTDDCHQSDLRGGFSLVDDVEFVAPSCYQCHDEKWDDDGNGGDSATLSIGVPELIYGIRTGIPNYDVQSGDYHVESE